MRDGGRPYAQQRECHEASNVDAAFEIDMLTFTLRFFA